MADIPARRRNIIFDYSGYDLTEIPLVGERRYFNIILSGITNSCSVLGDGSNKVEDIPFLEIINIETSSDINLEILRIDGNKTTIENIGAIPININIGTSGIEDYYILLAGDIVSLKFDGTDWQFWDSSVAIMGNSSIYLMASFANKVLYLYASGDGKKWKSLSGAETLYEDGTSLRDPSIIYRHGKYWIAYTNVQTGAIDHNEFKIISSTDLIVWEAVATIDCSSVAGPPNVGARVWAPEWYIDNDDTVYIFVFIKPNAAGNHAGYYLTAQNDAMTSFTNPVLVTLNGGPTDWIDGYIVKIASTYYLWYKDEVTNHIEYATGSAAIGPYTTQENGDWAGWGAGIEGPSLVQINATLWRIYFHKYPSDGIFYSESSDTFASWTAKTLCEESAATSPYLLEHGTVLKITNFDIMLNMLGLFFSRSNQFRSTVTITEEGLLILDFNAGIRLLMDGETFGHFIGSVTGDDTLFIDNRSSDPTKFRNFVGPGWNETLIISQNGNLKALGTIASGTLTHAAVGPTDDLDVSGVNTVFIDASSNHVTIGGFAGGVDGQKLAVVRCCAAAFNVTLEHNEPGGTQKIFLHAGGDETLFTEYGGWNLVCNGGTKWLDVSHAKHV